MATPINMPQVGQDLETAKIIEWHVKEGDQVKKGDVIATVESDKASFEVEAFEEGTILKILFEEGEDGFVFKPIAYIGESGETIEESESPEKKQENQTAKPETLVEKNTQNTEAKQGKVFSSPAARRVAAEQKIDITQVEASGPNNRITKKDVLVYAEFINSIKATPLAREVAKAEGVKLNELSGSGPMGKIKKTDVLNALKKSAIRVTTDTGDEVVHFDKVRKIVAQRLSMSKQTIPHYYLNIDVDVENALKLKDKLFNDLGIKVSFNDILVQVVAKVLLSYKLLNSHVDDEKIVIKKDINIGIAVSTEKGLFVPVLGKTDQKKLPEISSEIRKLAQNARKGIVNPAQQGTFTISNLGMFGISGFQAIINPPECAILSVGGIEKKIIPANNSLKITDMVNIGMAVDHRAVDGAYAAQFLNELKQELTNIKL